LSALYIYVYHQKLFKVFGQNGGSFRVTQDWETESRSLFVFVEDDGDDETLRFLFLSFRYSKGIPK